MSIVIEFPVPPTWVRNDAFWKELETLGATKEIVLRTSYRQSEDLVIVTATSKDDLDRVGECEVKGLFFRDFQIHEREIKEAIRFAVWKLVHTGEEDEEEE